VVVARPADLGTPSPYEFALLDPGFSICDFDVFNLVGPNTVIGQAYLTDVNFDGSCGEITGGPYSLTGVRVGSLAATATPEVATDDPTLQVLRNLTAMLE